MYENYIQSVFIPLESAFCQTLFYLQINGRFKFRPLPHHALAIACLEPGSLNWLLLSLGRSCLSLHRTEHKYHHVVGTHKKFRATRYLALVQIPKDAMKP